jgi:uncharacterized OsmC-like protein
MIAGARLKQWSMVATLSEAGLSVARAGLPPRLRGEPEPAITPVEYLLMSIASCFALSLQAAIVARDQPFSGARVIATGEKAAEPPSRLARVELCPSLNEPLEASEMAAVLGEAKRLCTVTNTLASAPALEVSCADEPRI